MQGLSRRSFIRAGLLGGGALAAPAVASAQASTTRSAASVRYDVATLGQTIRMLPLPPYPTAIDVPGAFRGWALYMEGAMYPEGTVPGSPSEPVHGFDPAAHEHIGTWFGWGYLVEDLDRSPSTDPTFLLTSQYVLGVIGPDAYFPSDQLVSSGLEFAHTDQTGAGGQAPVQPVTGGSGRFAGATGTVVKRYLGTNVTGFDDGAHAPRNYRLEFQLLVP